MATRRERVILDLQDDFSAKMIKAAGAAALLNRELDSLSGKSAKFDQSSQVFVRDVQKMGKEADGASRSIDRMSGRIGMITDAILLLGPAAIPIGALVVPAVMTLTSSLAALAVGAGTTAIAFGGVGDAISAANKAHLEPTVENLAAAEELFSRLAPAVEDFAKQFNSMRGLGVEIRNAGAQALFPGLTEALETLESRGPEAIRIMTVFNETIGDNAADAAASLASDKWNDFFAMIEREGPPTLDKTADALGDVAHGVSELLEAFAPMSADGMDWIGEQADDFNRWATGLKRTEGFKDFSDYIRDTGPQVAETLSALSRALLDILEAAAPLGGPVLQGIEAFAEAVSAVADSDLATPLLLAITAMRTINRLAPVTAGSLALLGGGAAGGAAGGKGKGGRKGGAGIGLVPWQFAAAYVAMEALTADWEEATDRQVAKADEFAEEWGKSLSEQAEAARVKLSELLDVSKGKGPFGLLANDKGLSEEFLNAPLERQLELRKQLREEYGVGLKKLEEHGILVEGTTRQFEHQREAVHAFTNDFKRMSDVKASPKIDVDDRGAKQKQRVADDWILGWGKKNAKATADVDGKPAKSMLGQIGDLLAETDDTTAVPKIDINDGNSRGIMAAVRAELANLDGDRATVYIDTVRTVTGPKGAAVFGQSADGGSVPKSGKPYADRFPYLLADGEEVTSNRRGQADRYRPALKAINADMPREVIKGMLAGGGTTGWGSVASNAMAATTAASWDKMSTTGWAGLANGLKDKWLPNLLRAAEKQLEAAEEAAASAKATLEATIAQSNSFASSVAGNFDNDPFGNGLSGAMLQLEADTNDANTFDSLIRSLSGSGLDGAAFGALSASGDINTAQQLSAGGPGSIAALEAAFAARSAAQSSVGGFAANAQFGTQIAEQTAAAHETAVAAKSQAATVARLEQTITRMENKIERMEAAVERGSEKGTRAGNDDRNKDTKQRERAGR